MQEKGFGWWCRYWWQWSGWLDSFTHTPFSRRNSFLCLRLFFTSCLLIGWDDCSKSTSTVDERSVKQQKRRYALDTPTYNYICTITYFDIADKQHAKLKDETRWHCLKIACGPLSVLWRDFLLLVGKIGPRWKSLFLTLCYYCCCWCSFCKFMARHGYATRGGLGYNYGSTPTFKETNELQLLQTFSAFFLARSPHLRQPLLFSSLSSNLTALSSYILTHK